jgi:hypothetical protein
MFQPHEIIARLSPALTEQLFTYLVKEQKKVYQAAITTLAQQRKFRPVFVQQMPTEKRHAWMKEALGRQQNDSVAAHLLQIWFVGGNSKILCDFLDSLGIAHDEHGTLEKIPPAPEIGPIKKAVDETLAKNDPGMVAVYLHAFQALDDTGGWDSLEAVLKEDERLKL